MPDELFARLTKQQLMAIVIGDDVRALAEMLRRDREAAELMTKMFDEGGDPRRIEALLDREDLTPEQGADIVSDARELTWIARSMDVAVFFILYV